MDIITLSVIISLLATSYICFVIFYKSRNNFSRKMLGLVVLSIILWVAPMIGYRLGIEETRLFWSKTLHFTPTFIASTYLIFCLVFPSSKNNVNYKFWIFAFIPNLFFALVIAFGQLVLVDYLGHLKYSFGPFAIPLVFYYITYFLIGFFILLSKYRKTKSLLLKQQIKLILIGFYIAASIALTTNLILPIYGYFYLNWLGQIVVLVFIGLISYSIVRHRLMDIRAFVFKSLAYTLTLLAIAGVYISIFYLAIDQLSRVMNPLFNIALLLVFVLTFQSLRKVIEKPLDKVFAKNRYDFEALLKKISTILSNNLVLDNLSKKLLGCLAKEMKIQKAAFMLKTGYCEIFEIGTSLRRVGASRNDWNAKISSMIDAFFKIAQPNKALVADELEDDDKRKKQMRKQKIEVLVYFYDENKPLGYLALSEKVSGDAYSAQDLKLMEIIAPQVSIALKNIEQQQQMIEQIIEERHRIDQDAHDRIYNRLGALAKKAELAEVNPKEAQKTLSLLKTDLRVAVDDLQRIVKGETEAQNQDNAYIIDELKKICEDFKNQSSIKLDFNCACDSLQLIDPKNLWHFQCILEECLNNIRKHSKATQVNIDIAKENSSIILEVKDNGIGMKQFTNDNLRMPTEKSTENSKSKIENSRMGLSGMQERAQKINGTIAVTSNNGSGTKVTLTLPVE